MTDETDGVLFRLTMPDGREANVLPLFFGKFQASVGEPGDEWYERTWHYDSLPAAVAALTEWAENYAEMNEPTGWFREPSTGRRRPDGDPGREHVRP